MATKAARILAWTALDASVASRAARSTVAAASRAERMVPGSRAKLSAAVVSRRPELRLSSNGRLETP
uniref:Uncharacterized protein n=1 Tax=Arundo donax TaxID=35708 RepID=A0A0A8Z0X1_ARUDO